MSLRGRHSAKFYLSVLVVATALITGCREKPPPEPTVEVFPISPADNFVFHNPDTIQFSWVVQGEADEFEIEIAMFPDTLTDGRFIDRYVITRQEVSGTTYIWNSGNLSGRFFWHVHPLTSLASSWSGIKGFIIERDINLTVPIPVSPANGSNFNEPDSITFIYLPVPHAERYQVQVSADSGFQTLELDTSVSDTSVSWLDFRDGVFWWRVRALIGNVTSNWSQPLRFTINSTPYNPVPPQLLNPSSGMRFLFPDSIIFRWSSVRGARRYRLQIARSSEFSTTFIDTVVTSSMLTIDTIWPPSELWIRLKSYGRLDSSGWSSPVSVTILPHILFRWDVRNVTDNLTVASSIVALLIDSLGLMLYDVTDPSAPEPTGGILWHLPGLRDMDRYGDTLLIPSPAGDGIRVIDVSDPYHPVQIVTYTRIPDASLVKVMGGFAYVVTNSDSLFPIELTDVRSPRFHPPISTGADVKHIDGVGNALYIASSYGIVVYDVSNAASPRPLLTLRTGGEPTDLLISPPLLWCTTSLGELYRIDISDPLAPVILNVYRISDHSVDCVTQIDSLFMLAVEDETCITGGLSRDDGIDVLGRVATEGILSGVVRIDYEYAILFFKNGNALIVSFY